MRVKIGDKIYDSKEEPILILSEEDYDMSPIMGNSSCASLQHVNICKDRNIPIIDEKGYCFYPDSYKLEDIMKFIRGDK